MPTSAEQLYLDSSALVKLVIHEPESDALDDFLARYGTQASSQLALVEVVRAVETSGPQAVLRARQVLRQVDLLRLDREVLESAATIGPLRLRSLDAIHLASAVTLGRDLRFLVTYDQRLAEAAISLGLPVASPAA